MKINLFATADQLKVLKANTKFISFFAGRRWGKTFTARNRILFKCSTPNFKYWYITPSYAQNLKEFKALADHKVIRKLIRKTKLQPYPKIEMLNGSEISYRTFGSSSNLRGDGVDEVFFDEVQDADENSFNSVVLPLLSDSVLGGTIVISGQFRGKNWYYEKYYLPGLNGSKDHTSFRFPTSSGIKFIDDRGREELDLISSSMPKRIYDIEYECLPLANSSAVFDQDDLKTISNYEAMPPAACVAPIIGLDLGRVVDPSALVVIDADSKTVFHEELRPLGEKHEIGSIYAAKLCKKYKNAEIIVDTTGGATGGRTRRSDAYVKHYQKKCKTMRPFTFNRENKERIITNLCLAIEQGEIHIPKKFDNIHRQLASYEYNVSRNGILTYQGPGGHDDDLVIALALAWEGVLRGWYKSTKCNSESFGHSFGG